MIFQEVYFAVASGRFGRLQRCGYVILSSVLAAAMMTFVTQDAFAEDDGDNWDVLNQEAHEFFRAGEYDRAVVAAKKALEIAEENRCWS